MDLIGRIEFQSTFDMYFDLIGHPRFWPHLVTSSGALDFGQPGISKGWTRIPPYPSKETNSMHHNSLPIYLSLQIVYLKPQNSSIRLHRLHYILVTSLDALDFGWLGIRTITNKVLLSEYVPIPYSLVVMGSHEIVVSKMTWPRRPQSVILVTFPLTII